MKFRKKPVIVDAVQYTPGLEDGYTCYVIGGGRFVGYHDKRTPIPPAFRKVPAIKTAQGHAEIDAYDWIITRADGSRYVCSPRIFEQFYEAADGPPHEDEAHEMIRETYVKRYYPKPEHQRFRTESIAYANGMMYVLNTLGIKIEGVNAQ
ncbi:hypothetical protein [Paenibacillus sp. B-A-8]|uniref:hypothetical protein n=1 Tax=Paenibacillus sp. B-A-8 TaxID=3400419 RepID=UPI003B02DB41